MLVTLDMGATIINLQKKTLNLHIFRMAIFFQNSDEKNSEQNIRVGEKKSRIRETLNLSTNPDKSTDNEIKLFLRGMYGRTYRRTEGGREGGRVHWSLAGSSGGTRNSQKKSQLSGVNFDRFRAILVIKNK